MSDVTNQNTIKLKVNEFIEMVHTYITNTNKDPNFTGDMINSFMMWGAPGVGKSASLKTLKNRLEQTTGKKVVVTDVRLLLFNPVDLRGIPVPNVEKTLAIWLKPQIFQMDDSEDIINILMLDEISAAPPSVQAAAYQITLDRKIGEHHLPDNCYIVCAGNRVQDKSVAYKMPKALANRLTHFDIESELDDWKIWAIGAGISPEIIGFLNYKSSLLYNFNPTTDDNAFPTPRTWEMTDKYLKVFGSLKEAYNCIAGCIGLGAAGEFKRYCNVYAKIPNVQNIFNGEPTPVPTEPDILYSLSAAITNRISNADKDQISNVIKYIDKMPDEFSVLTMKDILLVPGMKEKLVLQKDWVIWANNKKMLIL